MKFAPHFTVLRFQYFAVLHFCSVDLRECGFLQCLLNEESKSFYTYHVYRINTQVNCSAEVSLFCSPDMHM